MTSGDSRVFWAVFTVRQFKLLHQVTKEVPNLDAEILNAVEVPESLARRLLELVRRGRAEIGSSHTVRIGFDDGKGLELRREIAVRSHDDILEIDSGTTTGAADAWNRLGRSIAAALGTPEFHYRTGGTPDEAAEVFTLLGNTASSPNGSEL